MSSLPLNAFQRRICAVAAAVLWLSTPVLAAPEFIPVASPPAAGGAEDAVVSRFEIGRLEGLSGRIAFSAAIDGRESIFVLDLDARKLRRFVESSGNDTYPVWSPRGTRLSFTSDRDGNKEIYLTDWEGLHLARLTRNSLADDNASWLPDGSQLIYYADSGQQPKEGHTNLFLYTLADGTSRRLTSLKGRNTTPQYAPSGPLIAFSTNRFWPGWDICLWNAASGVEDCPLKGRLESYCRPAWSPSGQQIAYSAGIGDQIDLAVMNLSDRSKTTLTSLPLREYDAAWSPSGGQILFAAENGEKGIFNLYLLNPESRETVPLLKAPYSLRFPNWTAVTTLQLESQRVAQDRFEQEPGSAAQNPPPPGDGPSAAATALPPQSGSPTPAAADAAQE